MEPRLLALLALVACPAPTPPPTDTTSPTGTTSQPTDRPSPGSSTGTDTAPPTDAATLVVEVQSTGPVPAWHADVSIAERTLSLTDGQARFEGLAAGSQVVRVHADGFVDASLPVDLVEGRRHHTTVALLPYGTSTTFDAGSAMRVQHQTATVDLPPNAFVDASGQPVTGMVTAHVTSFDAMDHPDLFPGSMSTLDKGRRDILNSFGMVDVTVVDDKGDRVQLAPGQTARLELGVDPTRRQLGASAPVRAGDVIDAWSYDETTAFWVFEGQGRFVQDAYEARLEWVFDAPHFSWWNADQLVTGGERTCVMASFEHEDGRAVERPWQAVVRGGDYAGMYRAVKEIGDDTCVDAPLNSSNTLYVGRETPEFFQTFQTDGETASCDDAELFGCPTSLTLTAPNPSCICGTVIVDGYGRRDVLVTGRSEEGIQDQVRTNTYGDYCMDVPSDRAISIKASLLDDDGRFNEAEAVVATDGVNRTRVDGNCLPAEDLELSEEDVFCVAGRIQAGVKTFGKALGPIPQGTVFHVFGDDFTPSTPRGGTPAPTWQNDYASSGVIGADGTYCVDLPTETGDFEIVVDPFVADKTLCATESSPAVCFANSEVLSVAGSNVNYAGIRCRVDPAKCLQIDLTYDQDF